MKLFTWAGDGEPARLAQRMGQSTLTPDGRLVG
jgi:hypothetical protein